LKLRERGCGKTRRMNLKRNLCFCQIKGNICNEQMWILSACQLQMNTESGPVLEKDQS
jgi:hypothetical protein